MPPTKTQWTGPLLLMLVTIMSHAASRENNLENLQTVLGIPDSIAKVTSGHLTPGEKLPQIILIQDVHRHPEVQGHIAALLLHGARHWGLKDVYLEGAQYQLPVARPIVRDKMALRDSLIEGHLSGAEMAVALEPQSPIQLHGLEDPAVYLENIMAYEQVEELRPAALRELETARLMQTSLDLDSGKWTTDADGLLRRMLQLRMKPVDYAAYLQQPYKDQSGSALSEALQAAEKFYRVADKRSHWFLKILESAPASGPHMAVVGGYHTALMAEELEHEGISYVVLTPHITQSGYDELYARGMQSTISALKLRE